MFFSIVLRLRPVTRLSLSLKDVFVALVAPAQFFISRLKLAVSSYLCGSLLLRSLSITTPLHRLTSFILTGQLYL